jgi:hypothetical protein
MNISALIHTHQSTPSPSSSSTASLDINVKKASLEDPLEVSPILDREETPTVESHDPVELFIQRFYGTHVGKVKSVSDG